METIDKQTKLNSHNTETLNQDILTTKNDIILEIQKNPDKVPNIMCDTVENLLSKTTIEDVIAFVSEVIKENPDKISSIMDGTPDKIFDITDTRIQAVIFKNKNIEDIKRVVLSTIKIKSDKTSEIIKATIKGLLSEKASIQDVKTVVLETIQRNPNKRSLTSIFINNKHLSYKIYSFNQLRN